MNDDDLSSFWGAEVKRKGKEGNRGREEDGNVAERRRIERAILFFWLNLVRI